MEPEGLSGGSRWTQTHSRGRGGGWWEEGERAMMKVNQPLPRHGWSHPPLSRDPWNGRGCMADGDGYYEPYGGSHSRSDRYHWRPT